MRYNFNTRLTSLQQRKVLSIQHLQCGQSRVSSRPRTSGGRRPGTLPVGSSSKSEPSCCPVEECQLLGITYKVDADADAVVTTRRTVTWILTTVNAAAFGFKLGSHTQSPSHAASRYVHCACVTCLIHQSGYPAVQLLLAQNSL